MTDILVPTMDGYDFVRRLRSDPGVSRTRVVFYAATYLATEARVLAQSCGVARVIGKPIDPEEVLRTVDQCLSSGSESVLPWATLPEDDKDRHIRVLSIKLLERVAELEVRNDELEAAKLSLEKEMATRKHADEELRTANEKLSKSLSDLECWNHEVALLSEMGQLLDSCLATEEAHAVVKQFGEKLHIGDSGCVYLLVVTGPYVMIAVADTGCGMDRKTQSQIFDPFFTTKELGKGTGLGLATVYGIVKQSSGYIWVYSEVGQGTVFKVYLPRAEQAFGPSEQTERDGAAPRGSETILLAEDSEALLEIARECLRRLGYTVIDAVSGEQALERANEFDGTIHLLLTDVVMPGMSGRELADQIVSKRPGIKVLFTSGYADDAIARHGLLEPSVAFIQKLYHPKALARKVREVLGQPVAKGDRSVPPRSIAFPTTA